MNVMVELSLYPLVNDYIGPIKDFIERINTYKALDVVTTSTSTQVSGDYQYVMSVLGREMEITHREVGQAIFVAKFLNFDAMQSNKDKP